PRPLSVLGLCPLLLSLPLPPLSLSSFPTRRSSDLVYFSGNVFHFFQTTTCYGHARAFPREGHRDGAANPRTAAIAVAFAREGARDRKSTRLNSSHQIISYAVSCFKTKRER